MIRRILTRLFIASITCLLLIIGCVAGATYLAFQPPRFYAALAAQPPTADQVQAAEQRLQQIHRAYRQWQAVVASVPRLPVHALPHDEEPTADAPADAARLCHTARVSAADINALLASSSSHSPAQELSAPRVAFENGQIRLAFKVSTPAGDVVLSFRLVPQWNEGEQARLQVASAHIGRLPLPLATLAHWLPEHNGRLAGRWRLDVTGKLPQLVLEAPARSDVATSPTLLECADDELVIHWTAPRLDVE